MDAGLIAQKEGAKARASRNLKDNEDKVLIQVKRKSECVARRIAVLGQYEVEKFAIFWISRRSDIAGRCYAKRSFCKYDLGLA